MTNSATSTPPPRSPPNVGTSPKTITGSPKLNANSNGALKRKAEAVDSDADAETEDEDQLHDIHHAHSSKPPSKSSSSPSSHPHSTSITRPNTIKQEDQIGRNEYQDGHIVCQGCKRQVPFRDDPAHADGGFTVRLWENHLKTCTAIASIASSAAAAAAAAHPQPTFPSNMRSSPHSRAHSRSPTSTATTRGERDQRERDQHQDRRDPKQEHDIDMGMEDTGGEVQTREVREIRDGRGRDQREPARERLSRARRSTIASASVSVSASAVYPGSGNGNERGGIGGAAHPSLASLSHQPAHPSLSLPSMTLHPSSHPHQSSSNTHASHPSSSHPHQLGSTMHSSNIPSNLSSTPASASASHPITPSSHTMTPAAAPKRRRAKRTEDERIAYLRADPYIAAFEPYRVLCASCDKWIRLRPNSTYCSIPWDAHRKSCLSKKGSTKHLQHLTPNMPPQTGYPPRSASHVHLTSSNSHTHNHSTNNNTSRNSPSSTSNNHSNNSGAKGRSPVNANGNGNGNGNGSGGRAASQASRTSRGADGRRAGITPNSIDTAERPDTTPTNIERAVARALAALPCALPTSAEQRNALLARDECARKWDAERVLCAGCDRWVDIVDPGTLLRRSQPRAQQAARFEPSRSGSVKKGGKGGKSGSGKGVVKDEDEDMDGKDGVAGGDGDMKEGEGEEDGDAEGEDEKEGAEGEEEDPYERWIRHREACRAESDLYARQHLHPSHPSLSTHPSNYTNAQRPTSSHSHSSRPSTQQSGFSTFSAASASSAATTRPGSVSATATASGRARARGLSVNCNETKYTTNGNVNAAYSDDGERGGRDRERGISGSRSRSPNDVGDNDDGREGDENGEGESPTSATASWGYAAHQPNAHGYAYNPHPSSHPSSHPNAHLNVQHSNPSYASSHPSTSGPGHPAAPSHESRRRNAEQRASTLRSDALIGKVEPNRVFCKLCEKWVQLRQDSSYCAYPWLQHRGKCLARHQRRIEKEAAIASMRARRHSGRGAMDGGMGQEFDELVSDADGDADADGEVDADGDVDASVMMDISATHGRQDGHGRDGEGEDDDLDLESEEGVEGSVDGRGDEQARRRKRRRMSNGLGVGVGANGAPRGGNGKHVSSHPLGGHTQSRGAMYGNGNGNGNMNGGGPMIIDELDAEGEDDVDAEGEPYSEDQIVRTYSPQHHQLLVQQQHGNAHMQYQQYQQRRPQYNRRQGGGQGGQVQGARMGAARGGGGGYARRAGQPVGLADLDSLPGRRNFIFLAIDHLFCTTYENSDDMTISSLLTYLNAAMPPDKHEDFDTSEVVKAVAAFKEKGKVIFEGDTLRLVD